MTKTRLLVLIDGHALLYRAYFAFPRSLTLADGQLVNAAFGFTRILLSTLVELKPTHIAVSFDVGKTFRHQEYEEYKAHREKMPEELKTQEPIVQEVLNAMNVPMYSVENYEADDVIGTVSKQATTNNEDEVVIVTGDRDMYQLVNDHIRVFIPGGGKRASRTIDRQGVYQALSVWPEQVPDFKGLAGDGSDNIPGVAGIGPKTAAMLMEKFGSIEELYKKLETTLGGVEGVSGKIVEKLIRDKEKALVSKHLATIFTQVPIPFDWQSCKVSGYDREKALATLYKYNFKSLVPALPADEFEENLQEALF